MHEFHMEINKLHVDKRMGYKINPTINASCRLFLGRHLHRRTSHHRCSSRSPKPPSPATPESWRQTCSSWSPNPAIYSAGAEVLTSGTICSSCQSANIIKHYNPGDLIILSFLCLGRSSEQCTCSSRSPKLPSPFACKLESWPQTCSSWSPNPAIYYCGHRSLNDLFLLSISKHHQHCHPGDQVFSLFFLCLGRSSEQCRL